MAFTYTPYNNLYQAVKKLKKAYDKAGTPLPKDLAEALEEAMRAEKDIRREAKAIAYAREEYADPSDNDIEIDDNPLTCDAGNGVWINAWVWVPNDAIGRRERK